MISNPSSDPSAAPSIPPSASTAPSACAHMGYNFVLHGIVSYSCLLPSFNDLSVEDGQPIESTDGFLTRSIYIICVGSQIHGGKYNLEQ